MPVHEAHMLQRIPDHDAPGKYLMLEFTPPYTKNRNEGDMKKTNKKVNEN